METAPTTNLLDEVEKFLDRERLSATQFGALTVGDTKFVKTLRAGRKVRAATQARIRAWMAAQTKVGA